MHRAELVVEAVGVTKWYGETTALDGVGLTLAPAVIHGLLGPNGAGKTTLLSVLFGLVRPDEGSVRLFGRTRAEVGPRWLDGVGGFVETPRFYPYLSGKQNLTVLAGLDGGRPVREIDEVLDLVGLAGVGGRRVRGYSSGMTQRLGLAAAILRHPRLLILDEPSNGMDPAGIRDLRDALRHLADGGLAVLLSSHDMDQIDGICDGVSVLHQGRIVFGGSLATMRAEAPNPAWRLRTSDDAATMAAARSSPAIEVWPRPDGDLLVRASQDRLDAFVVDLGRAGIAVRGLVVDVTPLASMFFHLTEAQPGETTA
jgi:ABC-2 type transport system ATP-binding protein